MGAVLVRSAFSANIKERRDCSTALFDERGRMIAQAEHIPVHLGAMPDAVAAVMARDPAPGEVWAVNDPYTGGTHLPDITLVSRTEVGFGVTRAHHADVGGREPGSMPADSTTLADEGVIIPPTRLDDATLDALIAQMRNPEERRGDLRAQLAAHHVAERRLAELCRRRGRKTVVDAMGALYKYSERRMRAGILALPDGAFGADDVLEAADRDLGLHVAVTIDGEEIDLDFEGTTPQHEGNLNCPLAVTRSACYFVVRALELQYPRRVERYGLRLGSGGYGRTRGGDGVVRELRVLEPARLSIISERRRHAPRGQHGGAPGARGRNLLNGQELAAKVTVD